MWRDHPSGDPHLWRLWGVLFFSVIALSHSPHTIAFSSPLLVWLCSQIHFAQSILFTGPAHIHFAIFISSFCHTNSLPTPRILLQLAFSSLHLCQVISFNGGPSPLPCHCTLCCRRLCPCHLLPTSWSKILAKGVVISNCNMVFKLAVYFFFINLINLLLLWLSQWIFKQSICLQLINCHLPHLWL